jgi:hypothetical protein
MSLIGAEAKSAPFLPSILYTLLFLRASSASSTMLIDSFSLDIILITLAFSEVELSPILLRLSMID